MTEAFVAYIWKFGLFEHQDLKTILGESVQVLEKGRENTLSGPDFFNAKIQIDETTWAGNVEIHIKASDWVKHQHDNDEAYDNVILHVVWEADMPIKRKDGSRIPTIALQNRVNPKLYGNYLYLQGKHQWIPCEKLIDSVDGFTINIWVDRLLVERLQRKTQPILTGLEQNKNNWETTFYHFIARAFGTKANADAFELLAKSLPLSILAKHKSQLLQVEALLFGQAGFLDKDFKEDYPNRLKKEYLFLKQKFDLTPLKAHSWKTGGVRPPNLPTIRIAQFATLIYQSSGLFSKILAVKDLKSLQNLFQVKVKGYWLTHYVFDKESKQRNKSLGKTTLNGIIINTIVPMLFVYGEKRGEPDFKDTALRLLEKLPAEKNTIIKKWAALHLPAQNAFDSQALLQLKNEYCDKKRCLNCAIGSRLIRH